MNVIDQRHWICKNNLGYMWSLKSLLK